MKRFPILFKGEMVRAILEGRKRQTRRIIKGTEFMRGEVTFEPLDGRSWRCRWGDPVEEEIVRCPYGTSGDQLWVREMLRDSKDGWSYAADDALIKLAGDDPKVSEMLVWAHHRERDYCPSIHMPKWASRITLDVTNVRVEQLQSITGDEVILEGFQIPFDKATGHPLLELGSRYAPAKYLTREQWKSGDGEAWLRAHFASGWNVINAQRGFSWEKNPWVWIVEFEVGSSS